MKFIEPLSEVTDSAEYTYAYVFNLILERFADRWDTVSSRLATLQLQKVLYMGSEAARHGRLLDEMRKEIRDTEIEAYRLRSVITSLERFAELANGDREMLQRRGEDFADFVSREDLGAVIEHIHEHLEKGFDPF